LKRYLATQVCDLGCLLFLLAILTMRVRCKRTKPIAFKRQGKLIASKLSSQISARLPKELYSLSGYQEKEKNQLQGTSVPGELMSGCGERVSE
jgi:hypothetical protein